jgi:hypothetical protein
MYKSVIEVDKEASPRSDQIEDRVSISYHHHVLCELRVCRAGIDSSRLHRQVQPFLYVRYLYCQLLGQEPLSLFLATGIQSFRHHVCRPAVPGATQPLRQLPISPRTPQKLLYVVSAANTVSNYLATLLEWL